MQRLGSRRFRIIGGAMGLFLLLLFIADKSRYPSPAGCPALPQWGPAGKVSLYVEKALDQPGIVCVRVINGLSDMIEIGPRNVWLEGENSPVGTMIAYPDRLLLMRTRGMFDYRLPQTRQPAPSGKYRVCFRSRTFPNQDSHTAYSPEFSLP